MTTLGLEERRFIDDVGEAVMRVQDAYKPTPFPYEPVLEYLVSRHGKSGVMKMLRERIAMGQQTYGELARTLFDDRDFRKELDEELLDALVYDWCDVRRDEVA